MQNETCNLSNCFLCRLCVPEWKEAIKNHKQTITVEKGREIFREGDEVKGIFFISEGSVKVYKKWTEDKELIVRFARTGDILGHRGIGGSDRYPIGASALESTKVCFISNDFFEASLKINHLLTYQLMHFYAMELQQAEKRMRDLAHSEVKGRIAQALLEISDLFGLNKDRYFAVPINRQDIASYAGTTYKTIFKFFKELTRNGIISTSGKNIRINQAGKLKRFIAGN